MGNNLQKKKRYKKQHFRSSTVLCAKLLILIENFEDVTVEEKICEKFIEIQQFPYPCACGKLHVVGNDKWHVISRDGRKRDIA